MKHLCEICKNEYDAPEQALECERNHNVAYVTLLPDKSGRYFFEVTKKRVIFRDAATYPKVDMRCYTDDEIRWSTVCNDTPDAIAQAMETVRGIALKTLKDISAKIEECSTDNADIRDEKGDETPRMPVGTIFAGLAAISSLLPDKSEIFENLLKGQGKKQEKTND